MILKQRRFRRLDRPGCPSMWASNTADTNLLFCTDGFAELFDIPADVKQIWLTLRDKPGMFSVALHISESKDSWFPHCIVTTENGQQWSSLAGELAWDVGVLLREYIGRTVHLEVEYERR